MTGKHALNLFSAALFLSLSSGCVSTSFVKNEPRDPVKFASATGAQIFYEAYIENNYTRPMPEHGQMEVGVRVQLPYEQREYSTDSVYFNVAVRAADTNRDGIISDEEARQYSATVHPTPKGEVAVAKP